MIAFEDVSYSYPNGFRALNRINLGIGTGELVTLVGENGSGKTTLVKHLNGLLKPFSGRVLVFGQNTRKASVAQLARRVGIVFQNPHHQLFEETCEKEISFALRNFGLQEKEIEYRTRWSLSFLNLENYATTSPLLLSGGEKKRLCIASVLSWDPDVLILDEPTVGQDYLEKEKLRSFIREVSSKKTVIIVSHDVEFFWPLQPRVIVMKRGMVIADGPCAEIFCNEVVLNEGRLIEPQLVSFFKGLKVGPRKPFINVEEAKSWIVERLWKG